MTGMVRFYAYSLANVCVKPINAVYVAKVLVKTVAIVAYCTHMRDYRTQT